ncbi:siderophore synthetase component [Herbihabitans rhizosphaerae]|uniref:Siderophore synthetase component n=1 Tax=Herbihabitans rhizosphaerae TaxID=1872711 RepID=A0A4Q7KW34_9PSEU|nr:IucA/IucC family protein [Herbihabitans rhizosphaerae]RZS40857.1 siderophore synthetase component [Herbihabitans rhizosphaerae]
MTVPSDTTTRGEAEARADEMSAHTLLGCLHREVSGPAGHTTTEHGHLVLRLPHNGFRLRARLRRTSTAGGHRFAGPPESDESGAWRPAGLDELTAAVASELTLATGTRNDEFAGQVTASRDTIADILRTRPATAHHLGPVARTYVDSEQALVAGHPRHPAPKWRSGQLTTWRRYAPEARTAFRMRWLDVPPELIAESTVDDRGFDGHTATERLLGGTPSGRALPVHPWQFHLLTTDPRTAPALCAALADGVLRDLGETGLPFHPTASVRTLYQIDADVFLKASLNVRITNCLRKNAAYELAGAVHLTRLMSRISLPDKGFHVLAEPASRTVALPERYGTPLRRHAVAEGLGVIARTGLREHVRPHETVHLVATLAAAERDPAGTRTRLADFAGPDGVTWAREWWRRYIGLLVPPVLRMWAEHGVVLEPHPQNVLVVLDPAGMPVRVLARDLEGTKLLAGRHADTLATLPSDVARAVAYDDERGWNRVAYCLFVNNLAEVAGALADLALVSAPGMCRFEDELWDALAALLESVAGDLGRPPRLGALIDGEPLPAKANLLLRWSRRADLHAGYVPLPNPMRGRGR